MTDVFGGMVHRIHASPSPTRTRPCYTTAGAYPRRLLGLFSVVQESAVVIHQTRSVATSQNLTTVVECDCISKVAHLRCVRLIGSVLNETPAYNIVHPDHRKNILVPHVTSMGRRTGHSMSGVGDHCQQNPPRCCRNTRPSHHVDAVAQRHTAVTIPTSEKWWHHLLLHTASIGSAPRFPSFRRRSTTLN